MSNLENILKDFDFPKDLISEIIEYDNPDYFDNNIPVIEYEVGDNSYYSNTAIIGMDY